MVLYNPCNHRGCPKCYQKNQLRWMEKAQGRILPTTHLHLVFSIPGRYVQQWLADRKGLTSRLFEAVDQVIKDWEQSLGLRTGRMLVFQSHGRGMSYKPHIHCLMADGGLDIAGQWKPLGELPLKKLTQSLSEYFVDDELFEPVANDGWSVYVTRHGGSGEQIIGYLAHTMAGVVVSIDQGMSIDQENQTISFEDGHGGGVLRTTLKQTTFLERYLSHIPPERTVTVRYYGLYSNRHREELEAIRRLLEESRPKNQENDPPPYQDLCPCCQAPMHLILVAYAGQSVNYAKYGFIQGPPEHREYRTNAS